MTVETRSVNNAVKNKSHALINATFTLLLVFSSSPDIQAQTVFQSISAKHVEQLESDRDFKALMSLFKKHEKEISNKLRSTQEFKIAKTFADALEHEGDYLNALLLREKCLQFIYEKHGKQSIESADAMNNLARTHKHLGNYARAIELHKRGLLIYEKKLGSESFEASTTLNNLAAAYSYSNQLKKALPLHLRSLKIREKILGPNHPRTANALDALAGTYFDLGEVKLALTLLEKSLAIRETNDEGDHHALFVTLNNLGLIQNELGLYEAAIKTQEQALKISETIYGTDHATTAGCLLNIASTRTTLGQYDLARPLQQRALAIYEKALGNEDVFTGIALTHLANTALYLKNYEEALNLQLRGLNIFERKLSPFHRRVASALNNLAAAHWGLNDFQSALPIFKRNLEIKREIFGSQSLSTALAAKNLATIYVKLNRHNEGFPLVTEALAIYEAELGPNHPTTTETYTHLVDYEQDQSSEYSIYLLKKHINAVQAMRGSLLSVGREEVSAYTEQYKSSYQTLAAMLVDSGRLSEAQQVLDMLKEDEYFQFIRRTQEDDPRKIRASYTSTEQEWMTRYQEISGRLASLGAEERELAKHARKELTSQQNSKRKQLNSDLKIARIAFQNFLSEMRTEFSKKGMQHTDQLSETSKESTSNLQTLIREIDDKTAVLQYFITDERVGILLTTPGVQIARNSKISRNQLNLKISSFIATLRDPKKDPTLIAQEMFRLLLTPVETDLEQAGIKTLLISLDGALRYIPIGALHDGKNFAINRWSIALYNPVVKSRLKEKSSLDWTAVGMGRTRQAEGFTELPSVENELRSIIKTSNDSTQSKGILTGELYLDDAFTPTRLKDVSQRSFDLLHVASHFRFSPGTEVNSFLLLGDGTHLSLGEIRSQGYRFDKVELLTLSACETGLGGGRDSDGKEIDGLGVLVQKQGAKAVISTLWSVADESTSKFMIEMYAARKKASINKAEALRQAQLTMLRQKRYSHPFYWAPYTLMGNWQ